ncbi:clavesin-1-like [Ischnura elegans]|uniref:clavesin-1-like n=1 Tax=Ischnura elegans TaxID=197161 RepID=UPI001ED87245|nr:clavesin-1-like [Ischnura elegans]XP_046386048.1 clavesin-1-like [Ischnura elegans]XP_046386049.1 clavesin-1-like [Ischnura elegans]
MALQRATDEQMRIIMKEIRETPNSCDEDMAYIRSWLNTQPHLPKIQEDRLILAFIRGCKHDRERVKSKMDMYFTVREVMPEFFAQRDPMSPEIQDICAFMQAFPLPKLTPGGCRVTLHRFMDSDGNRFNTRDCFKYVFMTGDIRLMEEEPIIGDVFLFDMNNISLSYVSKLGFPMIKKVLTCAQEAYPQRLKQLHFINAPTYIDKFLNLFKALMKEKMRQRFHVHSGGMETLHKWIHPSVLPSEYGGQLDSIDKLHGQWMKKLESYRDWFLTHESIKADSSKRISPIKSFGNAYNKNECEFGWEGSFRRLNID